MLRELYIHNLAVISEARIELSAGLNCFTGATGAGKSLVIGAVEVLLGLRAPGEMLRKGADEGRVSGVFEIGDRETLRRIEQVTEVPVLSEAGGGGGAGEVMLTRRLFASGRSSISLNGRPITLAMLRAASELLVDVHGQHDQQYLLKPSNQLEVLDAYAGLGKLNSAYAKVWTELSEARRRLEELAQGRSVRQQQLELYRFQANEIDAVEPALEPGELEALQSKAKALGSVERIEKEAGAVYSAMYEADESVAGTIKSLAGTLEELAELDAGLKNIAQTIKDAAVAVEEGAYDLARYVSKLEVDPEELARVNERLTVINRLASKYAGRVNVTEAAGDEVSAVLRYREEIGREIAALESDTEDLSELEGKLGPLETEARRLAGDLSAGRRKVAGRLAKEVEAALAELGMERATFQVQVEPGDVLSSTGLDTVDFLAATNPGLSAGPLRKIASGGELSRIMLALKGILAAGDRVSVLVFDEIDSNVGGRLGAVIGTKLRHLARGHQVLCITHLPQIACYADRHLTVRKSQGKDETTSVVKVMEGNERLEEIAEMIGGKTITETTRAQARELLESAMRESSKVMATAKAASVKR
jgi:DNA repair protein RecN (Recombination protein N)